jgi:hypothetical protein
MTRAARANHDIAAPVSDDRLWLKGVRGDFHAAQSSHRLASWMGS